MNVRRFGTMLGAVAALAVAAGVASADPIKQIEARKGFFQGVKAHMGPLVAVSKKEAPYGEQAKLHASGMLALANMTATMFPAGSDMGDTRAKGDIWSKSADFAKAVDAFKMAAAGVAKADEAGFADAVGNLGKACKGCHDSFREK